MRGPRTLACEVGLRRRAVGLAERLILWAGMSLLAFAVERQLKAALERRPAGTQRRGRHVRIGGRTGITLR